MFIENKVNYENHSGCIEVITGSMFSGKTEELIRRLRRALIARQKVLIFKPAADTRHAENLVVSHDKSTIEAISVKKSEDILNYINNTDVVGIDEAQFFDTNLPAVCRQLANRGIRTIIAGLDMDFKGLPFGEVPTLMAISDYVTKLQAICIQCGNPALFTHRKKNNNNKVLIGSEELYEPLCRACYIEQTATSHDKI